MRGFASIASAKSNVLAGAAIDFADKDLINYLGKVISLTAHDRQVTQLASPFYVKEIQGQNY